MADKYDELVVDEEALQHKLRLRWKYKWVKLAPCRFWVLLDTDGHGVATVCFDPRWGGSFYAFVKHRQVAYSKTSLDYVMKVAENKVKQAGIVLVKSQIADKPKRKKRHVSKGKTNEH